MKITSLYKTGQKNKICIAKVIWETINTYSKTKRRKVNLNQSMILWDSPNLECFVLWVVVHCLSFSIWSLYVYVIWMWIDMIPKISACRARISSLLSSERSERVTNFIFCRADWHFSASIIFTFRWHVYHP